MGTGSRGVERRPPPAATTVSSASSAPRAPGRPSVGLFCKSYRGDFVPLRQLIESFQAHNPDQLTLVLSLPHEDLALFRDLFGAYPIYVEVVSDESYAGTDLSRFSGWHAQQICKLMSWHTMDTEHYLMVDSDCYFIRDLCAADLIPAAGKKYLAYVSKLRTVLKEKNQDLLRYIRGELELTAEWFPAPPEHLVDRLDEFIHYRTLPQDNPDAIARSDIPMKAFGRREWIYCQPGQIFSVGLLRRLIDCFEAHALSVPDAIRICPWEYNWYGEYAATFGRADTELRVSSFVHFQEAADVEYAQRQRVAEGLLRSRFAVVQMAARHLAALRFG